MTVVIAGSGPAGAFAAMAALESGAKILMIDPGLRPEVEAKRLRERLGARHFSQWAPEDYASLEASTLGQKKWFGSDVATRPLKNDIEEKNCRITQSNALGGLSNIWGRGIEPPYQGECDHWPFREDFFAAMRAVLAHVPLAAEDDNLAEVLPLYTEFFLPHRITAESQELLDHWQRHSVALNGKGVHFGKTRLALRPQKCNLCRMCFHGCAYGAMFDTGEIISALARQYANFEYRAGWRVRRFISQDDEVKILIEHIDTGAVETLSAEKLILAAGAPQTTAIAMRSLGIRQTTLKNSDLIAIPMFKLFGGAKTEENYHALSQLTLTIDRRAISKRAAIMHLFGRNPVISDAVFSLPLGKYFAPLLKRLYISMCFLHSDDSASIRVENDEFVTRFTGRRTWRGFFMYLRLLGFLIMNVVKTGLLPIPGFGVSRPGSSVHYGASLPVDDRGQLVAVPRVYVADAASLPDIPGGSYTLSIMANAYRIGKNAAT